MSRRNWRLFIEDILESIELVEGYVAGMEFGDFGADRKTVDAVVRNLEIIGEASKHVPDGVRGDFQDVDWKAMVGLRNRIAHEYFGVSLEIVWNIVERELPALKERMREILEKT